MIWSAWGKRVALRHACGASESLMVTWRLDGRLSEWFVNRDDCCFPIVPDVSWYFSAKQIRHACRSKSRPPGLLYSFGEQNKILIFLIFILLFSFNHSWSSSFSAIFGSSTLEKKKKKLLIELAAGSCTCRVNYYIYLSSPSRGNIRFFFIFEEFIVKNRSRSIV